MPTSFGKLNSEHDLGDKNREAAGLVPAVVVTALHKGYVTPAGTLQVLRGVDLACRRGESLAVIGASGVGKSTLLHVLGALDEPDSGQVRIEGVDPFAMGESVRARLRNERIGFVFQFHHLLPEFTAVENVAMPLWVGGEEQPTGLEKARKVLEELGLESRAMARPDELSGGERQRVAIARAMASRPVLLLADEPTGNLDNETAMRVYEQMIGLTREYEATLVVATHDLDLAGRTDRVLRLKAGRLEPAG